MSEIMTIKEVAAYLRVHQSTLYRLIKRGKLPTFRVGSDYRFNLSAIDAWRKGLETAMQGARNGHHGASGPPGVARKP